MSRYLELTEDGVLIRMGFMEALGFCANPMYRESMCDRYEAHAKVHGLNRVVFVGPSDVRVLSHDVPEVSDSSVASV